jgi:hypothetical protein
MRKNNSFTFAEVLLSLMILTGSVYIMSGLHFKSGRKVRSSADEIDRVFAVKKQLYDLYFNPPKKDKPKKVILPDPEITITTHTRPIDKKKSALKNFAKEINIIWADGTWKRGTEIRSLKMISFAPKPKPKKK